MSDLWETVHWEAKNSVTHSKDAHESEGLSLQWMRLFNLHKVWHCPPHKKYSFAEERWLWR